MSLLFANQGDEFALLISDTLVTHGDDPFMFGPKVHPFPHLNMAMASMGSRNFGVAWERVLGSATGLSDIESLDASTPESLRYLYADVADQLGEDPGSSTIYHYGFPSGSDKIVCYTYRSSADFKSERFEGPRFTAKPLPAGFVFEAPRDPQEAIALALRVRDLNNQNLGDWGVHIGGELYATLIENWSIHTRRWHRFEDYDQTDAAIHAGKRARKK